MAGLAGLLAGCAGSNDTNAANRPLKVWAWGNGAAALSDLAARYNLLNPANPVQVETLTRSGLYQRLSSGLEAGGLNLPDIATLETEQLPAYTHTFPEGFANLTGQTRPFVAKYLPSQLEAASFLGRVRALPWTSGLTGLFYRPDLLAKANIPLDWLATWDDFFAAGTQFQAANPGLKLLAVDPTELFQILLYQQGLSFFNQDDKINLNLPPAIRAANLIKKLNEAGLLLPVTADADRLEALRQNRVGLFAGDLSLAGLLAKSIPEQSGQWRILPLPAFDKGGPQAVVLNGLNLVILRSNGRESNAWPFLEFCQAQAATTFQQSNLLPAYQPAYNDPLFSAPQPYFGNQPVWQAFVKQIPTVPPVLYNNEYARTLAVVEQSQTAILAGAEPAATLQKAARQIQQLTNRELVFR